MPALQVRDFPEALYEELRAYAELNHRSIAQQTIVAVRDMLAGKQSFSRGYEGIAPHVFSGSDSHYVDFDTESEKAARIEKRKKLFAEIEGTRISIPSDFPDPVEVVREGREERSRCFDELMRETMGGE